VQTKGGPHPRERLLGLVVNAAKLDRFNFACKLVALVQDGIHAFASIGRVEQGMEQMPFVAQAV